MRIYNTKGVEMKARNGLQVPAGSHLLVDGQWSVVKADSRVEIKREFESMTESWVTEQRIVEV